MKKIAWVLAVLLALGGAGLNCVGALAEDEKPVLSVLGGNTSVNLDEDFASQLIADLTGYKLEYNMLPSDNPDEMLLLKIAGGEQYDFLKVTPIQYGLLSAQHVLMDITDLLNEYAPTVLSNVSPRSWQITTLDGRINGIPSEQGGLGEESRLYGYAIGGIGFRTDVLEELGLELPGTQQELLDVLNAIKEAKGGYPLTGQTPYIQPILAGYGLSNGVEWYDVDGKYTPFLKMPELVEYLTFMQKLYTEGLLDAELPINKPENVSEKFLSGRCSAIGDYSVISIQYDIAPLKENNPDALIQLVSKIRVDEDTLPTIYQSTSAQAVECVPYNSRYPEDYVKFAEARSDLDLYRSVYIGVEGESYTVLNPDQPYPDYYPILPEFSKYGSGAAYYGFIPVGMRQNMWFARVRKVAEMGVEFDRMNAMLDDQINKIDLSTYSLSLLESQKYRASLNTMINDGMVKAIFELTDPREAIDAMIREWEAMGGLEYEAAMDAWYQNFK